VTLVAILGNIVDFAKDKEEKTQEAWSSITNRISLKYAKMTL